jgi:hypothetical protein
MSAENALGYEQITNLSAAVGFTSIPAGTRSVWVCPESQAVRWRTDANPTATVGMPIAVGTTMEFTLAQLASVKFIEQAASAKLNVTYFG